MTTPADTHPVDVVLLGAGAPTSIAAAALARAGLRTALLDIPRFVGPEGSTTVPYTSELFELVADRLNLPEVRQMALHSTGPYGVRSVSDHKQCLSFGHHEAATSKQDALQFVIPSEHEEWHFDRRALDGWGLQLARDHGVVVTKAEARPEVRYVPEQNLWSIDHPAAPWARLLIDGSGVRDAPELTVLGAHRTVVDPEWQSVQVTCRTKGATVQAPSVPHAMPWDSGTTLLAGPHGTCQLASIAGTEERPARTTAWMTVAAGTAEYPLDLLRDHFGQFAAVKDLLGRVEAVEDHVSTDAFVRVECADDMPVLLWDHTLGAGPQMLSRDLTCMLEVVVTVVPKLIKALQKPAILVGDIAQLAEQQRALIDVHERWTRASLTCAGSWPQWNALLRAWLLWTIMGALSIKRERIAGNQDGWAALDSREGPWWYSPPAGVVEITHEALSLLTSPSPDSRDAERVFTRLRKDPVVPPLFDFGDPKALSYRLTISRRIRMLIWAMVTGRGAMSRLVTSDNVTGRVRVSR